jgi:hypothetical protein
LIYEDLGGKIRKNRGKELYRKGRFWYNSKIQKVQKCFKIWRMEISVIELLQGDWR